MTCGLWLARRRLVAAVLGPSGEARRVIRAALTDEARFGLIEFLAAMEPILATEALSRVDLSRSGSSPGLFGVEDDAVIAALLRAAAIRYPARAATLYAASRHPALTQCDSPAHTSGWATAPAPVTEAPMNPDGDERSQQMAEVPGCTSRKARVSSSSPRR